MADIDTLQFHAILSQAATRVEETLDAILPPSGAPVADAMRYATLTGGKRLRAFFVIETGSMFNVPAPQYLRVAAAAECMHAYSLIHDDLPCMDDDDMRRGKPTVHKAWDEATAVLAGDALQAFAYEILAAPRTAPDPAVRLKLMEHLAQATGINGMVGGQALDIEFEGASQVPLATEIERMQNMKTGALITWSLEAGAIMGKQNTMALVAFARDLGLAFQISDDILDVVGDPEMTGKKVGKDAVAGKATLVAAMGLEAAQAKLRDLVTRAVTHLEPYGSAARNLRLAAHYVAERKA